MKIDKVTPQIAALYLGQKCDVNWITYDAPNGFDFQTISVLHIEKIRNYNITITPHLRSLETITEEEAKELFAIESDDKFVNSIYHESYTNFGLGFSDEKEWALDSFLQPRFFSPEQFLYLLSSGFDLFNLIDNGLAKQITTQTNEL